MAISETQEKELRRLIKTAFQGTTWQERRFALEDAAKILDVHFDHKFVNVENMKPVKPRVSDEMLNEALENATAIDREARAKGTSAWDKKRCHVR